MPRFFIRSGRLGRPQRTFKVYAPWWVDPYLDIPGSSIEKMVLAELSRRGVFFIFRSQRNDLGGFVDPSWEADFLLPQHKIWIEVQGSYFHSLPGQIEKDSLRYAAIQMAGWKPVFLWEFDIRTRLIDLLDEIGVFYQVNQKAEKEAADRYGASKVYEAMRYQDTQFSVGRDNLVDQLVGLRKALAGRTKPPQFVMRRVTKRKPKR
jgi:very-short-patch-repair endonuclease